MPLDPSIILGYRPPVIAPPDIPTPLEQFGKVLTLRGLMQQGQLGELDLQTKMLQLGQLQQLAGERVNLANAIRRPPPSGVPLSGGPGAGVPVTAPVTPLVPPVQPTPLGGTVAQTAPPTIAPLETVPVPTITPSGTTTIAPDFGLPTAPAPKLSSLMTAAPVQPAAAAPPSIGAVPLNDPFAHLDYGEWLRVAPNLAPAKIEEINKIRKGYWQNLDSQHKANLAQIDDLATVASRAHDEPTKLAAIADAFNRGLITPEVRDQLLQTPYKKEDWDSFQIQALNAKERLQERRDQINQKATEARNAFDAAMRPYQLTEAQAKATEAGAKAEGEQQARDAVVLSAAARQDEAAAAAGRPSKSLQQAIDLIGPTRAAPFQGLTKPDDIMAMGQKAHEYITAAETKRAHLTTEERERRQTDPFGLYGTGGGGAEGGAPATTTAPAGTAGITPLAQSIANFEGFNKTGSVAQRNNNPGNLRAGPGQTGTDKNGYAIFPDVQTGWNALHSLIQKHAGEDLTLQEFIGGKKGVYPGYAPAADRNDPQNYAATVAKDLGIDPTTKLSDVAGVTTPARGQTPMAQLVGLEGQEFLNTLERIHPGLGTQVKAIAEGRQDFPKGYGVRGGAVAQQLRDLVAQYDPSFDVNNPGKRMATAKDFASGKSAQQVNALNTVIGHLDSLSQASDKLNNTWSPGWNTIANWVSAHTGHPEVQTFEATKKAVVDELTRVWRGTGGSEGDIKSWSATLDAANSPTQLHAVIAQIGDLLESKLTALQDQYQAGMGTISQGRQMITPKARQTLNKLEAKAGGGSGSNLPEIASQEAYDALPKGARYTHNGEVLTKK